MNRVNRNLQTIGLIAFFLLIAIPPANAWGDRYVPPQLQPWVDWVLDNAPEHACPFLHSGDARQCAWPSELELRLTASGGEFRQRWNLYRDGWVGLPGGEGQWPQQVVLDNKPLPVTDHEGAPAVRLKAGAYDISGRFDWDRLPEALAIPRATGLVRLAIDGAAVRFPYIDPDSGRLWVRSPDQTASAATEEDRLNLQVFRRLTDDLPLWIDTHLNLQVSGAQRELLLEHPLLKESIPVEVNSPLPARLEPDGRLRVQARPGQWSIDIRARFPGERLAVTAPPETKEWPADEVWSFESRNALRLVEVSGADLIDPRQTNLPGAWQSLPAYRLNAGQSLNFAVRKRGDPEPEPNRLEIERQAWLDFDGGGYTIRDRIGGKLTSGWRLESQPGMRLGRAVLDGQPQFITRAAGAESDGVEVRRGELDLVADSRWEGGIASLNATGWREDFSKAGIELHLPPGWRVLSVSGVDNIPGSWLQQWTLLDIFLVLITTIAIGRLWGWAWAPLALFTLVILWQEPGAPGFVWLNIVAATALLRVAPPSGRLHSAVHSYRLLSLAALVLISIPFIVQQVRVGLYPQLERPWQPATGHLAEGRLDKMAMPEQAPPPPGVAMAPAPLQEMEEKANVEQSFRAKAMREQRLAKAPAGALSQSRSLIEVDPNALVQTGPGVPEWRWHSIRLGWNGPVRQEQSVGLTLLSPWQNLALNILRILCLLALAARLIGRIRPGDWLPGSGTAAAALLLFAIGLAPPGTVQAQEIPSPELLEELKNRLLTPPDCTPDCSGIARAELEASATGLQLRLEVLAQERTALPLPGHPQHWLPERIAVDGQPALLFRHEDGNLWTLLEAGVHQVSLEGDLPDRNTVQIPLPLRPQRLDAKARGWSVEGIGADRVPSGQVQLTRMRAATPAEEKAAALEPAQLPPFVLLERRLSLGLDWTLRTRVQRLSPIGTAALLRVPLLPGESVTSQGIKVEEGHALINLDAGALESGWDSVLKKADIHLTAARQTQWVESWVVDVSPIWHMAATGIPMIHHTGEDSRWRPQWRPWPGESVVLHVTRPEGVEGNTLTIQGASLRVSPGQRARDASLRLRLESSQGGRHGIKLPAEARLQSVSIDGQAQPIRQQADAVDLPIRPGVQAIELNWRSDETLETLFRTPKVDLGAPAVNTSITATLGADRWVLFVGGPKMGPAVLFWGVLVAVALAAALLARIPGTPLKHYQWFLLGLGLTQTDLLVPIIVVGWLLALSYRGRTAPEGDATRFNVFQALLALWTLAALLVLFGSVQQGLLGQPDMLVQGNQSSAYQLQWFQDRVGQFHPQAWVLSLPIIAYRLAMLAWAMWLAFALLDWLRWGWQCFSNGGLWMKVERRVKP
ncbi:MAG: hypothetical protein KJ558_10420 [Gammaproteobacteria bacterium]|nr:hypothetical protein [Gammaproteobacteria bacterium]MBU1655222.1 hypothetical protein [Gammaproteobacteria bacterium]MBU1960674.1 hypothetical protein [Gammaproteobacteria bacterium]